MLSASARMGSGLPKAWEMAVDLVDQFAASGRYPANLAMNIRLFGKSAVLLHTVPGAEDRPSCNIQITSFNNPHWEAFQQRVLPKTRLPRFRSFSSSARILCGLGLSAA